MQNWRTALRILAILASGFAVACSAVLKDGANPSGNLLVAGSCAAPTTAGSGVVAGSNVLTIGVGTTALCGGNANIPCTSVTICTPGTALCQTIPDILIDTGSYGLRIFSQVVTVGLTQVTDGSANPIGECAQFGSATDWGKVMTADVMLGGESAVSTSIQVIDKTFGTASLPSACSSAETSPASAGINGILGVGLFKQDCGAGCVGNSANGIYYACSGGSCSGATLPLAQQVTNPVALLTTDNNGVIFDVPSVPVGGSASVTGSLILGIDTQVNNSSTGFSRYSADAVGNFKTSFGGQNYAHAFIDSGSNAYYLPKPSGWNLCSGNSWYCNGETTANTATVSGSSGTPSNSVCFTVSDTDSLPGSSAAFCDLAGEFFSNTFDWGLPFFYGRKVFVGIENTSSGLGTGPYWGF